MLNLDLNSNFCLPLDFVFFKSYQKAWWYRGKILGGSSNINDMIYTRGLKQDYDSWASDGAKGWAYKDVLPYFMKSENNENADFVKSGKCPYDKLDNIFKNILFYHVLALNVFFKL